jgi:PAS domain S-box-containing protein
MAVPKQYHSDESFIEESLFFLGNLQVDTPAKFRDALLVLTESTALALGYDRVGVWFFDETKQTLTSEDIFESKHQHHSSGIQVPVSNYPQYVEILKSVRTHALSHIDETNVPMEIFHNYFKKLDIKSIISSGIWCKGELIGVVSSSNVGRTHEWSFQERLYFASLGDLISKWMIQSSTRTRDSARHKISLRKLVKELSILCSRAGFVGFKEATQRSLHSINHVVHAARTRAVVIENKDSFIVSSATEEICPIASDVARRLFLLASHSKVMWLPDISKANPHSSHALTKLGFAPTSAVLIAPFGTGSETGFSEEKNNTHGIISIEFNPPAPVWNDGLREVLLCATDAFSILAEYAHTKVLYKESVEIARAAFQSSQVGMALFDSNGKVVKVNKSLAKMAGVEVEKFHRFPVWDVVPALKKRALVLDTISPHTQDKYQFEAIVNNANSDPTWGLFNVSYVHPVKHSEGSFLLQVVDITQRKKALLELAEQRTFFRTVIDTNPNFIFAKDLNGYFTLANKAVAEAYGTTIDEIVGKSDEFFNKNTEQVKRFREDDMFVLREGKMLSKIEEEVTDSKGATRYLQTVKCPIFDDHGKPIYILGVSTDITERKLAEEKKRDLLRKLEHTQKLESLGVLASGIAHDFNNLLLGIIGNSALSLNHIDEGNPARELIQKTVSAAENAAELTCQLLSYSGKGAFFTSPVDLTMVVRETSILIERITSKKGHLLFEVSPDEIIVNADGGQLKQVIMNIITNAADAVEKTKGEVHIKTYTVFLDQSPPGLVSDDFCALQGDYAVLEVSDNGTGMTEEVKKNIFDPFFTTKFTGRGLGLASVLGIVRSHKGAVSVFTAPEQGSTFRVYLPLADRLMKSELMPQSTAENKKDCLPFPNTRTILLIEDEEVPREVFSCMLKNMGYQVLIASNGEDGVSIFKREMDNISGVVLDLTMPKLDGREAFEQIRKLKQNIPILVTSGYHENYFGAQFGHDRFSAFIQKPFVPEALEDILTRIIT